MAAASPKKILPTCSRDLNREVSGRVPACLRQFSETLFDLDRHILAGQFACPTTEYRGTADTLLEEILVRETRKIMIKTAGSLWFTFKNEIPPEDLYID